MARRAAMLPFVLVGFITGRATYLWVERVNMDTCSQK